MIEFGNYSFLAVSDKVQKKALIELKIRNKKTLHSQEKRNFEYLNGLESNPEGLTYWETLSSIRNRLEKDQLKTPEQTLMSLWTFLGV